MNRTGGDVGAWPRKTPDDGRAMLPCPRASISGMGSCTEGSSAAMSGAWPHLEGIKSSVIGHGR